MEITVEHRRKQRDGARDAAALLQPRTETRLVAVPKRYDAIVIGGGHNGLVTAAYLARAGKQVLVLERRPRVGGAAVTEEIFPGFKFSMFSYVVSLLRPEIIRDLDLPRHGLHILPLESTVTPMENGDYLAAWDDHDDTRRELYPPLAARRGSVRRVRPSDALHGAGGEADPQHGAARSRPRFAPGDLIALLETRRAFPRPRRRAAPRAVKLMTMSSADFLDEWFETDVLKATKSASGIIGTFLGPRSPGTAYVLLHHYMGELDGVFRAWGFAKGGTGAVSEAIASARALVRRGDPLRRRRGAACSVTKRRSHRRRAGERRRDRARLGRRRASIRAARSCSCSRPKTCRTISSPTSSASSSAARRAR